MFVDFHVHTTASDGVLSPTEVVELSKKRGVKILGITDHDSVSGLEEALSLNSKIVPGIEISALAPFELHILGYFIDYKNKKLLEGLKILEDGRIAASKKMVEKLKRGGFEISFKEVFERAKGAIGRPHIAEVLVEKGYVSDMKMAFDELIGNGKPYYVEKEKISPEKCIKLILQAHGVPVLAHPRYTFLNKEELERLVLRLKSFGLRGIEVFFPEEDFKKQKFYLKLAESYNLLVTGGTDFHRGEEIGIEVEDIYVEEFLKVGNF